jgi:CheY-like chemotaxis protein/HPt (histidine-containing phosphotransfer) domain-containing protein
VSLPAAVAQAERLRRGGLALEVVLADVDALQSHDAAGVRQLRDGIGGEPGRPPALMLMASAGRLASFAHAGPDRAVDTVLVKPVFASRLLEALHRTHPLADAPLASAGAAPVDARVQSARARSEALRALAAPLSGQRILLAEDNLLNQIVAEELLRRVGLEVTVVDDGAAAVAALRDAAPGHFAAVLMDLHMPVLDGLEATRRIRALPGRAETPVIGMTAAALPEDRGRCLDAGMVDHIPKPVMPEHVIRTLLKWLPHRAGSAAKPTAAAPPSPLDVPATPPPALDVPGLRDRLHGNEALLWKLLAIFAEREAGAAEAVSAMLVRGDLEDARRKLHDLKGSAGNLGALAIAHRCAVLEDALKRGRNVDDALAGLRRDVREGMDVIRAALANRSEGTGF